MNRREFLKLSAAAAATAILPRWANAGELVQTQSDVLVIGAGLSGLVAANQLASDLKVTVLEARQRIGGRIHTDRSWGFPVELGRGELRSESAPDWLAEQSFLSINPRERKLYDISGKLIEAAADKIAAKRYDAMLPEVHQSLEYSPRDLSVKEALDHFLLDKISGKVSPAERQRLQVQWRIGCGADTAQLSARQLPRHRRWLAPVLVPQQGMDEVLQNLAAGLDIRLGQAVRRIEYGYYGVRAVTDTGVFEAGSAIVALPLGVIQSGRPVFEPSLSLAKQSALLRLGTGSVNKVALRFTECFWPEEPAVFVTETREPEGPLVWLNGWRLYGQPVMIALWGGQAASLMNPWGEAELLRRHRAILKRCFGEQIPKATAMRVARWSADPFAAGTHVIAPPGSDESDLAVLSEPLRRGRLTFAGDLASRPGEDPLLAAYRTGLDAARGVLH